MPTRRVITAGLFAPILVGCGHGPSAAIRAPDDMSLGSSKAKVTVVEYASVGCPVCGRWYREVWPSFKRKYIDTGRVRYVLREMLVGGDAEVQIAVAGFLLARCSGRDRYFSVIDALFRNQEGVFYDPHATLLQIARSEGMNQDTLNKCITDETSIKALSNRVESNSKAGGVQSTPTFVINGDKLAAGYHPLSDLDDAIAAAPSS